MKRKWCNIFGRRRFRGNNSCKLKQQANQRILECALHQRGAGFFLLEGVQYDEGLHEQISRTNISEAVVQIPPITTVQEPPRWPSRQLYTFWCLPCQCCPVSNWLDFGACCLDAEGAIIWGGFPVGGTARYRSAVSILEVDSVPTLYHC